MFEKELRQPNRLCISMYMKNDLSFSFKIYSSSASKNKIFESFTLMALISNKDDTYFIDSFLNSDTKKTNDSIELETKD